MEELISRGFKNEFLLDMGVSLTKEYKGTDYHYGIVISENGSVLLTNYDESDNKNIFCLNIIYIKSFAKIKNKKGNFGGRFYATNCK